MKRLGRLVGSLKIAVPLLIAIAAVLAWGTMYEARFGTAAVQRFVYHAWWFQSLLAFLALNLASAALQRFPWKRQHLPFVLAHIGIILILVGGIVGSRFGSEGQMLIPEGQAEHTMETPGNVVIVHEPSSGLHRIIATRFETQAWVHEPHVTLPVSLPGRAITLTVDRYYPDAMTEEDIAESGADENPAIRLLLQDKEQQDAIWLLSRQPERMGIGWGEAHVLFLEPQTEAELSQLLGHTADDRHRRGVLSLKVPGLKAARDIPVPDDMREPVQIAGTAYRLAFKEYFADFALTDQGPANRSDQPNNPAISFALTGPEGTDAYLLFALHPEFQSIHGLKHTIPADVQYQHTLSHALPPNCIGIIRHPASGGLLAVLTGGGSDRQVTDPLTVGTSYVHPSLGYQFQVAAYYPRAKVTERVTNRGDEIRAEALHVIAREGAQTAEAWLHMRESVELPVGKEPILLEYRPARQDVPVTIKLLDFRKIDYPGTQMAAGFESDVEVTDSNRGMILMRTISMNHPLRYRGYSFFQSSYIPGATETTILSVRNDPGTPLVYAGFIIVILGVAIMFILRPASARMGSRPHTKKRSRREREVR